MQSVPVCFLIGLRYVMRSKRLRTTALSHHFADSKSPILKQQYDATLLHFDYDVIKKSYINKN